MKQRLPQDAPAVSASQHTLVEQRSLSPPSELVANDLQLRHTHLLRRVSHTVEVQKDSLFHQEHLPGALDGAV